MTSCCFGIISVHSSCTVFKHGTSLWTVSTNRTFNCCLVWTAPWTIITSFAKPSWLRQTFCLAITTWSTRHAVSGWSSHGAIPKCTGGAKFWVVSATFTISPLGTSLLLRARRAVAAVKSSIARTSRRSHSSSVAIITSRTTLTIVPPLSSSCTSECSNWALSWFVGSYKQRLYVRVTTMMDY